MNWLVLALVGGAAAWFEWNYQRSKHPKMPKAQPEPDPVPEAARAAEAGAMPSISPGAENDKKLNMPV